MSSNLPPGVTDRMIEEQAGAFDEPMPPDVETKPAKREMPADIAAAMRRLTKLSGDKSPLISAYWHGSGTIEWNCMAAVGKISISSAGESLAESEAGWMKAMDDKRDELARAQATLAAVAGVEMEHLAGTYDDRDPERDKLDAHDGERWDGQS